jgi:hypothetical protein
MKPVQFKTLIEQIVYENKLGSEWIQSIPSDIRDSFFDNVLVQSQSKVNDLLLRALFNGALIEEVNWFLYEWSETSNEVYRTITNQHGRKYIINNVEDFCNFLIDEGYLED